jgi:hypothetical protein
MIGDAEATLGNGTFRPSAGRRVERGSVRRLTKPLGRTASPRLKARLHQKQRLAITLLGHIERHSGPSVFGAGGVALINSAKAVNDQKATGFTRIGKKVTQSKAGPVVVEVEEYHPPDTAAASFWLRNRAPDLWKERREVNVEASFDETTEVVIEKGGDAPTRLGARFPSPGRCARSPSSRAGRG